MDLACLRTCQRATAVRSGWQDVREWGGWLGCAAGGRLRSRRKVVQQHVRLQAGCASTQTSVPQRTQGQLFRRSVYPVVSQAHSCTASMALN